MLHTNDSETADAEPQRLRPSAIVVVAVFRGLHMQLGCQHHRHLNYGVVFSRNSHANATLQVGRGWWMELALSAAVSRVHCGKLASERLLDRKKVVNYFYLVVVASHVVPFRTWVSEVPTIHASGGGCHLATLSSYFPRKRLLGCDIAKSPSFSSSATLSSNCNFRWGQVYFLIACSSIYTYVAWMHGAII